MRISRTLHLKQRYSPSREQIFAALAAIKREERKLEKQLAKLQGQLENLRAAGKALRRSASREATVVKKRALSAAGRAKIAKAAKKRWAKVRAQAKKVVA
jgi:alkylated DNA nucleotide flippase Atl1